MNSFMENTKEMDLQEIRAAKNNQNITKNKSKTIITIIY